MSMRAILGRAQRMATILGYLAVRPRSLKTHITAAIAPGQNKPISAALESLLARGWVVVEPDGSGGRRGERWSISATAPAENRLQAIYEALLPTTEGSEGLESHSIIIS